jgi:cell division protein FtsB|tara:strand:- start:3527 stop:3835 length:309 start_codon:yes stop_codon:yes gene_type:complete
MLKNTIAFFKKPNLWLSLPVLLLLVLICFFSGLIIRTYKGLENFQAREQRLEQRLLEAENEFKRKEAYMKRLLEDNEFLERVARQRLGYAHPDELLFRFSEE